MLTSQKSILYAAPESDFQKELLAALASHGFRVTFATTLTEAMHELHAGGYNLLITDFTFPEGTALALLEMLRTERREIASFVLLDQGKEGEAARVTDAGAFKCFVKTAVSVPLIIEHADKALNISALTA